jgi:hypothetical protein
MLRYETARFGFELILKSKHIALRQELFRRAVAYASIHVQWAISNREQRIAMDPEKRRTHLAFVDSCDTLSRNMGKVREDNTWRGELGDDLKAIGDFACYIHLFLGLEAK